jgi:Predicted membrane protein
MNTATCYVSKKKLPLTELYRGSFLKKEILDLLKKDFPDFSENDYISIGSLNEYRKRYMATLLKQENVEISEMEKQVIESVAKNELLSKDLEEELSKDLTPAQRIADKIAGFGGSWTFILSFFLFLLLWMAINVFILVKRPFDPFPFILLNLILSCLAAIQAPVIMMSQNRKEEKDRKRSQNDYKVNLKAELEIKLLHEKIDHIIIHQNQRMLEIQQLQTDYLDDILKALNINKHRS